jgi:predicted transcriptional regulator
MVKRAGGELEIKILSVLWNVNHPMQAAEVREKLNLDLAYTSIATVLTRMWKKKWISRETNGRAFSYRPIMSREDWYAEKMLAFLDESPNQRVLLAGFVGKLSKRERQTLKKLLTEEKP